MLLVKAQEMGSFLQSLTDLCLMTVDQFKKITRIHLKRIQNKMGRILPWIIHNVDFSLIFAPNIEPYQREVLWGSEVHKAIPLHGKLCCRWERGTYTPHSRKQGREKPELHRVSCHGPREDGLVYGVPSG